MIETQKHQQSFEALGLFQIDFGLMTLISEIFLSTQSFVEIDAANVKLPGNNQRVSTSIFKVTRIIYIVDGNMAFYGDETFSQPIMHKNKR